MSSWVWDGGWVPAEASPARLDAADSWRHVDGRANGLELHVERFEAAAGGTPEGFWPATLALLDAPGDLFPRVARSGGSFFLDIRPAPPARRTTALALPAEGRDPRTRPLVKGPDLARLASFRAHHLLPGTDDVVLGGWAETTTGALVGWDGPALVLPAGAHLPSVTQAQVVRCARDLGVGVTRGELGPGMPLWFLNSLHGISPVTRVVTGGGAQDVPAHPRAAEWVAWWWAGFDRPGA